MKRIINRIKEDSLERIVEVFWVAIKAVVVTAIILLLLQIFPIKHEGHIRHNGNVTVFGVPTAIKVDQIRSWDVNVE
jgi:hypothetical protein